MLSVTITMTEQDLAKLVLTAIEEDETDHELKRALGDSAVNRPLRQHPAFSIFLDLIEPRNSADAIALFRRAVHDRFRALPSKDEDYVREFISWAIAESILYQ